MAIEHNITSDANVFLGEDKLLSFSIFQSDGVTPQDVAGWEISWVLRKSDKAPDPAMLSKSIGQGVAITGVYNVDPAQNTQRVVVTLTDSDTEALKPLTYRHSLKRTDPGSEQILSFGDFVLKQATAR